MRTILLIMVFLGLLSCQSERERQIEILKISSKATLDSYFHKMRMAHLKVDYAGINGVYNKLCGDSIELAVAYADSLNKAAVHLTDSIGHELETRASILNDARKAEWFKSKAGRIQKKHPEWTDEECIRISQNKVWVGMTLDMLKCERGLPNRVNPSDYGNGIQYQWVWEDYTPSCFYGGEDGVVTAYN